ncbi:MAG: alpha-amylase family glycosyl hydrolase, partial [Wenzhouxiangellaceae bacterium]
MKARIFSLLTILAFSALLVACGERPSGAADTAAAPEPPLEIHGTLEPFAAEAIYFVMTDRFVNGDPENDHRDQGGEHPTFDLPLPECDGVQANVGYLGGDFRGLLTHADYIAEMGFTSVWLTPIADNPDQAFTGGGEIDCDSILTDRGKTGYHGYWAKNFHVTDEHLTSPGLDFAELTAGLRDKGLKTVLDIVGNHGSPGWGMVERQPGFGQIFAADGRLLADHQNLHPSELDPDNNPLHAWFRTEPSLAELASLNPDNPEVVDYLAEAYLRWIDQGAAAFRVDTIAYMPHSFWKEVSDRIRAEHPGFYMVGEVFSTDPAELVPHTRAENGGYSVLDFPLRERLQQVFEDPDSDYALLADRLYLDDSPYANVYDLVTFYDNHDMARLDATDEGFIDAHNWLFTARGIPAVYYGSESGFMRGRREHAGNRNYFGVAGIETARSHPIREHLARIVRVRAESIALQRGVQVMLELAGHRAAFWRIYQKDGRSQIALVLLNKGDRPERFEIAQGVQPGQWRSALDGEQVQVDPGQPLIREVPAHDVEVLILNAPVVDP